MKQEGDLIDGIQAIMDSDTVWKKKLKGKQWKSGNLKIKNMKRW